MHALEKEALSDPFLAEALEGIEQAGTDNFLFDLHRINRSVHDRARKRSARKSKTIRMWGMTSAIAATVLLIAVSGFLVINILRDQAVRERTMKELAMVKADEAEKDTVYIPLPREIPVIVAERGQSQRDEIPQRRSAISSSPPLTSQADATGVTENPVETTQDIAKDDQDAAEEARLAVEDAETERERKGKAAEEEARKLEIARADPAETKSTERPAEVLTQDADKTDAVKKDRRAAGAESQSRMPAVARSSDPEYIQLRGKVVSAGDDKGLPGVNVIIKGTRNGTVTDADGNYQLMLPAQNTGVVFSFIGYVAQEVQVRDQGEVNVRLAEDVSALSEVVVTGYASEGPSTEVDRTFSFAEPRGGRSDFNDYLNGAVKYPQQAIENKAEGRVTVRFTVEPNGTLNDFEVLRGIGFGCEEELIRAIKEGPAWTPSSQGATPVRDKVRVRYKFELPQ